MPASWRKGWPAPLWRRGELSSGRLGPKNGEFALEFLERSLPFRRHRVPWIPVLEGTQGHRNVSRQKVIDLIPFNKLGARLLEKVPRPLTDGRYKAKMAVHLTVKDIVLDLIPDTSRTEALGAT